MRVLVCGGRGYGNVSVTVPGEHQIAAVQLARDQRYRVKHTLDFIHDASPIDVVIHGGASGADTHGGYWAFFHGIPEIVFTANWTAHGKAAGPLRNSRMLVEGKPDLVVAFPGGRGTADMVLKAKMAGVKVMEVDHVLQS